MEAPSNNSEARSVLATVVREERSRLLASLVRSFGFDLAEEALDAAIEAALVQWPDEGVPTSPRGWLLGVARRRAVAVVRLRVLAGEAHASLRALAQTEADSPDSEASTRHFPDERLRLLFTCCHPAIAQETQVALALRWLSGLSTEDVARAFCVPVATMAQRLTRAKSKITEARIPYEIPEKNELPERLSGVLEVVYAIFNEGYVATTGEALQRVDLAEEALRLSELVLSLLPERTEARAMHALLLLVHARRNARTTPEGALVPLEEQDRSRWDHTAIARGKSLLTETLRAGPPSAYAIEAAIQAVHDEAPSYAQTDFAQIVALYGLLRARTESPMVALNEAVARAATDGPASALTLVEALEREGTLAQHHALHASKAELLRRLGRYDEAALAFDAAIAATRNEAERTFLLRRRAALRSG